jgi:hypothetical protein
MGDLKGGEKVVVIGIHGWFTGGFFFFSLLFHLVDYIPIRCSRTICNSERLTLLLTFSLRTL